MISGDLCGQRIGPFRPIHRCNDHSTIVLLVLHNILDNRLIGSINFDEIIMEYLLPILTQVHFVGSRFVVSNAQTTQQPNQRPQQVKIRICRNIPNNGNVVRYVDETLVRYHFVFLL